MVKNIYSRNAIMKEFGLTKGQYRSRYEVFRRRVSNLNRLTGSNYSPIKEFRYSLLNKESTTIKLIEKMPSSPSLNSVRSLEVSKQYVLNKYSGLIEKNPELANLSKQINENYTPADFDRDARLIADKLKDARTRDATVGSEEISFSYVPDSLTRLNSEFITNVEFDADDLF